MCCHIWAVSRQGSGDWWCPCVFCLDEIPCCYSISSSQQGHYLHQQSSGPLGALLGFVTSSLGFGVTQQSQNWLVSSQLVQKRDSWVWVGQGEHCGLPSQALGWLEKQNPTTAADLGCSYQQQSDFFSEEGLLVGFILPKPLNELLASSNHLGMPWEIVFNSYIFHRSLRMPVWGAWGWIASMVEEESSLGGSFSKVNLRADFI